MERRQSLLMPAQLTSLFSNETIARLEPLRVRPRCHFTNRFTGSHLARRGGASTEFADFRDYVPGDDVRFVDWNSFSRLHRPYIKLFHEEEITHYLILIDGSVSMSFEGKFLRARQLAAAFGLTALRHTERVSVHSLTARPSRLASISGRSSVPKLLSFLEGLPAPDETVPFEISVENALPYHSGRGVVILLSDFLTFGDLSRAFNALYSLGLEILALQILGPSEIEPEVESDVRLEDAELRERLDVSGSRDLWRWYQEHRVAWEGELASLCQRRSGRFVTTSAAEPLEQVLFDTLRRRGWLEGG